MRSLSIIQTLFVSSRDVSVRNIQLHHLRSLHKVLLSAILFITSRAASSVMKSRRRNMRQRSLFPSFSFRRPHAPRSSRSIFGRILASPECLCRASSAVVDLALGIPRGCKEGRLDEDARLVQLIVAEYSTMQSNRLRVSFSAVGSNF